MALVSTGRARERVLVFGLEGVGKSLAALDIASRIHPHKLWVVDNDNAWDRMLEGQTVAGEDVGIEEEWRWDAGRKRFDRDDRWETDGGNVIVYHCEGWAAGVAAIREVVERAQPDDFWCIDSASALWSDVQSWFTEEVFGTTMDDYFMDVRREKAERKAKAKEDADAKKAAKALGAFDGWVDWPVINAQYKQGVMKWLVNPPCHLILTAEQADIATDEKDKETLGLYRAWNVKPNGQKRLGHNMQTVLMLSRDRSDRYFATTLKDRGGREKVVQMDVSDVGFSSWYLEDIGGWADDDVQNEQEPAAAPAKTKQKVRSK